MNKISLWAYLTGLWVGSTGANGHYEGWLAPLTIVHAVLAAIGMVLWLRADARERRKDDGYVVARFKLPDLPPDERTRTYLYVTRDDAGVFTFRRLATTGARS